MLEAEGNIHRETSTCYWILVDLETGYVQCKREDT
jgi:hypothetical protein